MGKKKILLVEDEPDLRMFVALNLKEHGYEVYEAEDGLAGLKRLLELKPDLIITDVLMPKMNGNEFYKKVRELDFGKDIPFVILTMRRLMQDYFEALDIDEFVPKPFETKDLLEKIEKIFERQALKERIQEETQLRKNFSQQGQNNSSGGGTTKYCSRCNKAVPRGRISCPNCGGRNFSDL